MRRVIFFPYNRGQGEKQTIRDAPRFCCFPGKTHTYDLDVGHSGRAVMQWEARARAKGDEIIDLRVFYKDDPRWPGSLQNLTDGQIYIVGHCTAGGSTLCTHPSPSDDGAITVEIDSIIGDLQAAQLSAGFRGRIKAYACESGLSNDLGEAEFSSRLAREVRKHWPEATVWGYLGAVDLSKAGTGVKSPKKPFRVRGAGAAV